MRYQIRPLTPIHIGDGSRLSKLDAVWSEKRLWAVDINKLVQKSGIDANELADAMELGRAFDMERLLREHRVVPAAVADYSLSCPEKPRGEILTQLKDGFKRTYIPGSSIKGAIRTALLWIRLKDDTILQDNANNLLQNALKDPKAKKEHFAQEIERITFGKDPNHDFMRSVSISDTSPISLDRLEVQKVGIMNLSPSSYTWKMYLFAEAISEGTTSFFDMNIDKFLLEKEVADELGFREPRMAEEIPKICNSFAKQFIKDEIKFYANCEFKELEMFYQKLLRVTERRDLFLLHLGWGSGWHGMTVARLFPEYMGEIRSKFKLGRRGIEEFPKTRKIAFCNLKKYPLGWAWVTALK